MARKSTARRGGVSDEATTAPEAADHHEAEPVGPRPRRQPRSGAGGRWWVWLGRAVLWAFIIVVLFNGIWLPFRSSFAEPSAGGPAPADKPEFPETAAAAFALRFGEAYLNPKEGQKRDEALAQFLPEGRGSSLDLAGTGLTGKNIEVFGVDAKDANNAVVTLSADVNSKPMSLDVPVYAADGGGSLVLSGEPALLAAPAKAELPDGEDMRTDADARATLEPFLEGFFEAYAQTPEHLGRYFAEGAQIASLPKDAVRFGELRDVVVPEAPASGDDVREVRATVVWTLPGDNGAAPAQLTQSYLVTVEQTGGDWSVRDLRGAPNSFGT
ncbi:conjugative transposon protein TcpC [Murinocardiopsis flavida]|uniref:Conjugative transposon protein TcpC n=1 Tax=Murinocardiopsis flavida TaxID=645275 RepID=A0A2P8DJ83_9ACTN|nr:conjugal transfer protein [Murinocardiopsis flavida]PSK97292.1 conjugative transposon protein TcpC [Murinocardiopsis flavida]